MLLEDIDPGDYMKFIKTKHPIRVGCFVRYWNKEQREFISGEVYISKYVKHDKSKHIFVIEKSDGKLSAIDAVSLYAHLLEHKPGVESLKQTK